MTVSDLVNALARLPEREAKVIVLRFVMGLTFVEVGEVLGVSRARVWQLQKTAVTRMRKRMRAL